MGFFNSMNVSASGMTVQQLRTDIISQNLANINTTRDENGNAYVRKTVVVAQKGAPVSSFSSIFNNALGFTAQGVKAVSIVEDKETDMRMVYEPENPDADENGYVTYPNVDTVTEMTNMIDASRSYEANVTAFNASKSMLLKTLEIGH